MIAKNLPPPLVTQPSRQHPRVDAPLTVQLFVGNRSVLARATDLSLAGLAVVDPAGELRAGHVDRVALRIPGEPSDVVLRVRLARRQGDKVALQFAELDWDDLFCLARYLSPRL